MKEERNVYYIQYGIGAVKYAVLYHTIGNYHRDGSEFYDIHLTNNKKNLARFEKELKKKGYIYEY